MTCIEPLGAQGEMVLKSGSRSKVNLGEMGGVGLILFLETSQNEVGEIQFPAIWRDSISMFDAWKIAYRLPLPLGLSRRGDN